MSVSLVNILWGLISFVVLFHSSHVDMGIPGNPHPVGPLPDVHSAAGLHGVPARHGAFRHYQWRSVHCCRHVDNHLIRDELCGG